jgi:hypothetical protein
MNQQILIELIRKLKAKPELMRKFKIFAFIAGIGFLLTGALTIWAGAKAITYLSGKAEVVMQTPETAAQIEKLKTEAKGLTVQPLSCWLQAQSLLAVETWLARPVMENLNRLKLACFKTTPPESSPENI